MPKTYSEAYADWLKTAPTFSFKQVEAILAQVFGVVPEKRKAFTARLQQLQKLGLPAHTNVGRGKRVAYEGWQLAELQFAFDLIDSGVTPSLVASRFRDLGFFSVDGAGRFGETAAKQGVSYFVHVRFNAIEHLSMATPSLSEGDATFNSYSAGREADDVVERAEGEPGIIIDLGKRLTALRAAVSEIDPTASGKDLFMHLAAELEA